MIVNYPRMRRRAAWPTDLDTALEFASPEAFSISVYRYQYMHTNWDGEIEYCNGGEWKPWDGSKITSGETKGKNAIYLRGTRNGQITGDTSQNLSWVLAGESISCNGNIELLLDWRTVKGGGHPIINSHCCAAMFYGCTSLITAPELPATSLESDCYASMFYGCTSLTAAPALPATTLASGCCAAMFYGCTSLITAPELPATSLESDCYASMFYGCTSLTAAPALPATTLASGCCAAMFYGCTSLITAPELPAIALMPYCYASMFYGCTSLTTVPALPATDMQPQCYASMFRGCIKIKVSATASGTYTKAYRIPMTGGGWPADAGEMDDMFADTGGTFTGTPKIDVTYYLDKSNTIV